MVFSLTLITVLTIARLWNRFSLYRISYRRRWRYRRGFPGEETRLRIEVENQKLLPLSWLRISDRWPEEVRPLQEESCTRSHIAGYINLINLYSLRWHEKITRNFELRFRKRGLYPLGPVEMESGDLFGLYRNQKEMATQEDYLTVFPELLPLNTVQLRADDPFGDRRSQRRLFQDINQPYGIRSYHPEDDFRHVHWPATAHTGNLQVKMYQPVSSRVMVICLNVATTLQPWLGAYHNLLEHLLKVSATIASQAVSEGYAVGLISNGYLSRADQPFRILPGRSPQQLTRLLEALAAITPLTSTSFENFLARAIPSLPYGAALVIVTALHSQAFFEALIRLKKYRSHTTVISLAETPPPEIPGIITIHLPFEEKQRVEI